MGQASMRSFSSQVHVMHLEIDSEPEGYLGDIDVRITPARAVYEHKLSS